MVTRGCMRLTDEGQLPATPAQHQPHPSQQPPTLGRVTRPRPRPSSAKCHRCWAGYKFAAKYLRGEEGEGNTAQHHLSKLKVVEAKSKLWQSKYLKKLLNIHFVKIILWIKYFFAENCLMWNNSNQDQTSDRCDLGPQRFKYPNIQICKYFQFLTLKYSSFSILTNVTSFGHF